MAEVTAEVTSLREFLKGIAPILFSGGDAVRNAKYKGFLEDSLTNEETEVVLSKFAHRAEFLVLLVELSDSAVSISLDVKMQPRLLSRIALVKYESEPLVSNVSISAQVQITTMAMKPEASADELNQTFYNHLLQINRHLYEPLIRSAKNAKLADEGVAVNDEDDHLLILQKRIRDLDFALEHCQKGTIIPTITLVVPAALNQAAKITTAKALANHIDKYNASQVDQLFIEVDLAKVLGEQSEAKEKLTAEINKAAKEWPAEITRQARSIEFPFPGSLEKEVNFWVEMDNKLRNTRTQLESAPQLLTKLVLKRTNKVAEQLIVEAESNFTNASKLVEVSLSFLRDFPYEELLAANSLFPKLSKCVHNCLNHFSKLKHSEYNFGRALRLLEVLGTLVFDKIVQILKERGIMQPAHCPIDQLRELKTHVEDVFLTWKTNLTSQRGALKDIAKRRNEKAFALKFEIENLQKRINEICDFREQHEKLVSVLSVVLGAQSGESSEGDFLGQMNEAYQVVLRGNADVFDISQEGCSTWLSTMNLYEKRLERVEEHITATLSSQLTTASTAEEMFRIFSLFNPLFFRPTIKNAVHSFRSELVKNVREDVKRLQEKFKQRYDQTSERITADLRDIPPLSGRILWAKQIETQLNNLMKRMQDVLGADWEDQLEGKQLKGKCDELLTYLDVSGIYEEWLTTQLKADHSKHSKVKDFLLLVEDDPRDSKKCLKVNFDSNQVVVFKEVKYLEWLLPTLSMAHKSIPNTLKSRTNEAYARYPIALALNSALSSFDATKKRINASNNILLLAHVGAVRETVKEAIGGSKRTKWVKWDSKDVNEWVSLLTNKIFSLQERVDDVTTMLTQVEDLLAQLQTCAYNHRAFTNIITAFQTIVDELHGSGLANIGIWVAQLDKRIEDVLKDRLARSILAWCHAFNGLNSTTTAAPKTPLKATRRRSLADQLADQVSEEAKAMHKKEIVFGSMDEVKMESSTYEIVLAKGVLFITPPLEDAKVYWVTAFHQHISVVASLPRIQASRYQVFQKGPERTDYGNILLMLPHDILEKPYVAIDQKLSHAKEYVNKWLEYQPLWDAAVLALAESIDRDNKKWQQLLREIADSRTAVENTKEQKAFGPIIVSNRQVQHKINLKYDQWQKESQIRFGIILLEDIKKEQATLVFSKNKLESISLDGASKDVIAGVQFILETKASLSHHDDLSAELKSAEKLLQSQRFPFPHDWMPVTNVLGPLADMKAILARRVSSMEAALPSLQEKLREEHEALSGEAGVFLEKWTNNKPMSGDLEAGQVLKSLAAFGEELGSLRNNSNRVQNAMTALGMDFVSDDRLSVVEVEMEGIKEAWEAVAPITTKLVVVGEAMLKDINIQKLRKKLEELNVELEELPAKLRSYPIVEAVVERIKVCISYQKLVMNLSTEALRDRHWRLLNETMNITTPTAQLTVGHIWAANAMAHTKFINETLAMAQGELALEEFLKSVRDHWTNEQVELVPRDGVKIVVMEDEVFGCMEDHLSSLTALKQSPYFKNVAEFTEETLNWENRLTTLRMVCQALLEVQKKWLYLRGIFKGSEIKMALPQQATKFKSADQEYTVLIKRISTKAMILELLQIDNLSKNLERQDSTMAMIQKALGEYLEKQRQIFPRFYFVNNDDLVEIVGNSNEPGKIITHFVKMFSAMSAVQMVAKEGAAAFKGSDPPIYPMMGTHMGSKEGEMVPFEANIDLAVGVKDWLAMVESQMTVSLATLLKGALRVLPETNEQMLAWISDFPAQVIMLASQVSWCADIESGFSTLPALLAKSDGKLRSLSESVLNDMDPPLRKKCEQLLTEMVHQRDTTRLLISTNVPSKTDFGWVYHLRFYWNPKGPSILEMLSVKMANASFFYGFEYLGIAERLVHTGLTDRCYLTLTQALHFGLGGNPFGPAGTGKTESVKMLGAQLGRFCLVFNCDKSFDYAAMGRIFSGLAQVGAWGCFDEFNRLEERILSAVSQQILGIQKALLNHDPTFELMGSPCKLSRDIGIFVTMNPGYAGRSNLPDNLKQMFRAVAMAVPDRKLIAQVMLYSQGIVTAESLSGNIVLLFTLCEEQLSVQSHYDFGLRALKSVLVSAGELKRSALKKIKQAAQGVDGAPAQVQSEEALEAETLETEKLVLIEATCGSIMPKLVAEDIPLFTSLLQAVFPGCAMPKMDDEALIKALTEVCESKHLEFAGEWAEKLLQLKSLLDVRHGVMLVGPSGTGKTAAWTTLLEALGKVDKTKSDSYIIDPKAIPLEQLYGNLDPNTLEWTDGVFTKLLRKVSDTSNGRALKRSWIIFDGDVDPEWAENLNSVLDDNKLLTLPSGDRLKIPPNVRILMEVDTLRHATLATVSRAGMVWYAADTLSLDMVLRQQLIALRKDDIASMAASYGDGKAPEALELQRKFCDAIEPMFAPAPAIIGKALEFAHTCSHIMEITTGGVLSTLYKMLKRGIAIAIDHNDANSDDPMTDEHLNKYAVKWLLFCTVWSFGGSMNVKNRYVLSDMIADTVDIGYAGDAKLLDLSADVETGEWVEWSSLVPRIEIEANQVSATNIIVATTDTVRHYVVIESWLESHKPLILCGPPGSGKSMTLTNVLDNAPQYILAALNFSAGSKPDLIHKTFEQYCEVIDSQSGLILMPSRASYRENQWLVIFMDECNLPAEDAYGTQTIMMFVRQCVEQGGFWNEECKWVTLKRIQFVGACNPPTDAGRVIMSNRFLRHAPLLLVDYPVEESFKQIYGTFVQGLLKLHPNLKGLLDPLTSAMVRCFLKNQIRFTPDVAPQYIYSPRELSRWMRALYEAMEPVDAMTPEELVRLWCNEGLRLFHDRCMTAEEKEWVVTLLDDLAEEFFAPHGIDVKKALVKPLLFSNQVTKTYQSLEIEELRNFIQARLKVFCEEELDVPLVIFDDVLDHVLRIDNVLSHPMGHLLLVGEAGVGKTVLTKFVSWMNGLTIFTIKANNRYSIEDFDNDLRLLLKRVGVDGEKISFIFDESNALDSAFLERMNSLLASGEVPGLYEGEERAALMTACRDAFSQHGEIIDSEDELQRRFTKIVQRNLHVIFTMNPAGGDFAGRCTTSPALFNRCVVDWFGTWPFDGLTQVGYEFTKSVDTGFNTYKGAQDGKAGSVLQDVARVLKKEDNITLTEAITAAVICLHNTAQKMTVRIGKLTGRYHFLSPRDYLDFINKFLTIEDEKRGKLQELANNMKTGLNKLIETQDSVNKLNKEMVIKGETLKQKEIDANDKLSQMIESQNEAEKQKVNAEKLTIELEKENAVIAIRKSVVEQELSEAEPMLNAAKLAVQGVKKSALDEVRALGKPPQPVRLTMECVCVMLGQDHRKMSDWAEVRKYIKDPGFIDWVLKYDPYKVTEEMKKVVMAKYINNPELSQEMVDKASKACGPLFMWAGSIVKYATLLNNIKPMTDEVTMLENEGRTKNEGRKQAIALVQNLENEIKQYKADYAISVRDTEMIRSEMETVTIKVNRAVALLSSLEEEKIRWSETSASFDKQMESLIGDNLLTAAFLTYGGVFDHKVRKKMMSEWSTQLEELGIEYRSDLSVIEYLSTSGDHLQWRDWGLPFDDLALQNAILLERFNRYPMIIDPSGQATNFLNNKYGNKLVKTSFLDANFIKILATAIRFGNPILVQDVETLDPVLNPILNKEFQKTGGRTLIRVGTEEIDFSPKFVIYLTTRNPLAQFAPDLCSRTTVVNFSVTPASLETQALTCVLKAERPDVDRRRTEVLKLQGAQAAKMQDLQDQLLAKISAVQGNILDDDSVVQTLERIKREAAELNESIRETLETLEDVKKVSNLYLPIAVTLAAAYFSLEGLPDVSFLYQYSLNFFLEVVDNILSIVPPPPTEFNGDDEAIATERLGLLKTTFFSEIARRVLRGLLYVDKVMFIVRLAQVHCLGDPGAELTEAELDLLLKGAGAVMLDSSSSMLQKFKDALPADKITDVIAKALISLSLLPAFTGLHSSLTNESDAWVRFIEDPEPEKIVPMKWVKPLVGSNDSKKRKALLQLLIIKAFRPERILFALDTYVSAVFGPDFDWRDLSNADLRVIVEQDSTCSSPIMLCSGPGQDASGKVDILATDLGCKLLSVSMGAGESFIEADKSLSLACKAGNWLLLKNVHLCADWLAALEKRLNGMVKAPAFRLFLTCEIHPKLPPALLRGSEVVVYEASTGVKANIQRFYSSIPVERIEKKPVERVRLYGLLAWFNAVVQERLRYTPLGWTKKHEFTEADTNCSLNVIDQWIDGMAGDRGNVDPADLPWDALKVLLSQSLFGGRIDHPFDQDGLDSFITSVFTAKNYEANAVLATEYDGTPLVTLPSNLGRPALEDWIKALPDTNSPSWIGLPVTAESQLKVYMAQQILGNLAIFQSSIDTSDAVDDEDSGGNKALQDMCERWMAALPSEQGLPPVTAEQTTDASAMPLERYYAREVVKGRQVIKQVVKDLNLVKGFCIGEEKTSNHIRDLMSCFIRGVIPPKWKANYTVSVRMTLATWIGDLSARLKNLDKFRPMMKQSSNMNQLLTKIQGISYWMGGLFLPEAMVTATRQQAAQIKKWALDQIEPYLEIGGTTSESCQESVVEGLLLEGAKFQDGMLRLSEELRCTLPPSKLVWRMKSERVEGEEPLKFPFYLNDNRNDKSVIVVLISKNKCDPDVEKHVWVQRSVGFIMQAPV